MCSPIRSWLVAALAFTTAVAQTATITPPYCQQAAPTQAVLSNVTTANITIPNSNPFGVVYATQQENIAFAVLNGNKSLAVLNTTSFTPQVLRQIPLPAADTATGGGPTGVALTHDGKLLFIASGYGAIVVNTARAATGRPNPVVGFLNGTTSTLRGGNAIEVTVSLDDQYVFVSQEYQKSVESFRLHRSNGSISGTPIGAVQLGDSVVGTALSPDGRLLYATSELNTTNSPYGSVSVLSVDALESDPSNAFISSAPSGCEAVRVIVSSDGKTLWVSARYSNYLVGYDAEKVVSDPNNSIVASVQVGNEPVGLVFARNETRILTLDSNRYGYGNTTGLSVIDVAAALAGQPAVLGSVPTGSFPREVAASPDGKTILVSDFDSSQIQVIDVESLP